MTTAASHRGALSLVLLLLAALSAGAQWAAAAEADAVAGLPWVEREVLPPEVAAEVPVWCPGAYVEREYTAAERAADPGEAAVEVRAGHAEYEIDRSARLSGEIVATQGPRRMTAQEAVYDAEAGELAIAGGASLEEPGVLLLGETAEVDLAGGDAVVTDARFVLFEEGYRGHAGRLVRDDDGVRLEDGLFTRCPPGDRSWKLTAERIEVPAGSDTGTARDVRLEVADVPVFWWPYLRFPVGDERQSGFLFPRLGFAGDTGFDIAVPYYFDLAPNYDATLAPRLLARRGVTLEAEFRHLTRNMRNTFGGAYMPEDDLYDGRFSESEYEDRVRAGLEPPGSFDPAERWLFQFDHHGRWSRGLTTEVDFTGVSDRDYFRDLGTELGVTARPELDRTGAVTYRRPGLVARLWAQDIKLLEEQLPEVYQRLPQLDVVWRRRLDAAPVIFGLDGQYARFDRDDAQVAGRDAIEGERSHFEPSLSMPLRGGSWRLDAEAAWLYTRYFLDGVPPGFDDDIDRSLARTSIDGRLVFERAVDFLGDAYVQTLEPRLYYLYVEDEGQSELPLFDTTALDFGVEQLFRDNRFSGLDRIGDANQLTAAVSSRLLAEATGVERLRATLGRIEYFDDREVSLTGDTADVRRNSGSGWVSELLLRLATGLDARALWIFDAESAVEDQSVLQLRYREDDRHLVNLAYRSRGADIDQLDAGVIWPVADRIALIGRWFYDLEREREIETFAGVQYDDCCWRVRLVGRRFRRPFDGFEPTDTSSGIYLEVVLKGLAGFDGGLNSFLENGIRGYGEQPPDAFDD